MNKEELAKELDGNQYRDEVSSELELKAKENGLVIIFGASDDLMEIRGAIDDEIGMYEGGEAYIHNNDILRCEDPFDDLDEMIQFLAGFGVAVCQHKIIAEWDKDDYSWVYSSEIPHASFDILEDDDKYCRGIVIDLKDLK